MRKQRVLFLCSGNSCRSHMAEGFLQKIAGEKYDVFSAGSKPAGFVHPLAINVMTELGVDISQHRSKSVDEFVGQPFDYVITVCDNAKEACPTFPGASQRLHWSFEDPARARGCELEQVQFFRRVRDEIANQLRRFVAAHEEIQP